MSLVLLAGWLIQSAAVVTLLAKVGRAWTRHLGAIFILLAVTYHGLGELLYRLTPAQNEYRRYVPELAQEKFFLVISVAILFLALTYVWTLGSPERIYPLDVEELRYYFDWRIMAVLTAPLAFLAVGGGSSTTFTSINDPQRLSAGSGLTLQFLLIALTMTGVALILRFGPRALIPSLVVAALVMASIGQRGGVAIVAIMLIYAASRIDVHLSRRWLMGIFVLGAFVLLVMTSSRAAVGRESFTAGHGASARFGALADGVSNIGTQGTFDTLMFDVSYRLDGNAFPSLQLAQIDAGHLGMGLTPFKNDVVSATPSVLYPAKIDLPLEVRSEKYFAQVRLELPYRDSLYTQLGGTVGYFGIKGLLAMAVLMGLLFARLDAFLLAGPTPRRLIIGVGALNAIAYYSASLDHWTMAARGVLLLLAGIWVLQIVRRSGLGVNRSAVGRPAASGLQHHVDAEDHGRRHG